ncbi:MAG: SPASM domain-containing protein [Candidatus Sumerlaeota bacterium]|nr:SPASM domain-containing protein [Candidatus Sumerlaeota bacterium]
MEQGIVENAIHRGPFHLELQPTHLCNLRCFFCSTKFFRKGDSLPWEVLKKTLEEGAGRDLHCLRLSGGGESLAYPSIRPFLDLCEKLGLRFDNVTTNGTLLAPLVEQITRIGADCIWISLNEPSAHRYAETMGVSEDMFHRAVCGVEAACAARDAAPAGKRPLVALQFFYWKDTYLLLPEMYRLARQLGVDQVHLKSLNEIDPGLRIPVAEYPTARKALLEMIEEDCRSGRFMLWVDICAEGELHFWAYEEQQKRLPQGIRPGPEFRLRRPRRGFCFMPFYSALIAATGGVYPCCMFMENPGKFMGSILEESLDAIWRGPRFGALRSQMRQIMLLGGDMEFSRKRHSCIEPICIEPFLCGPVYNLCSEEFYERVGKRMERETGRVERVAARLQDGALRAAHRALGWIRKH